jgi:hypothetical protein
MTDQELLEYAAKAVGFEYASGYWLSIINDRFPNEKGSLYVRKAHDEYVEWNPLLSDADAFGLMVDLNLTEKHSFLDKLHEENTTWAPDYRKAHRRAIVRAAAEIGRNMTE